MKYKGLLAVTVLIAIQTYAQTTEQIEKIKWDGNRTDKIVPLMKPEKKTLIEYNNKLYETGGVVNPDGSTSTYFRKSNENQTNTAVNSNNIGNTDNNKSLTEQNIPAAEEYEVTVAPNPYQTSTMISYILPKTTDVNIEVYNITGQKIAIIVNEQQQKGIYKYEFSAKNSGYSTGNYILKIKINQKIFNYNLVEMDK